MEALQRRMLALLSPASVPCEWLRLRTHFADKNPLIIAKASQLYCDVPFLLIPGSAQVRAALAVNRELVLLYWSIGQDVLARQGSEGWGAKLIDRLAHDLQIEFPGIEGFSSRSLKYMRALAEQESGCGTERFTRVCYYQLFYRSLLNAVSGSSYSVLCFWVSRLRG